MGRNLSPVVRRELANLDKDADSRKSAMKALRSYVKDLDSKAISQFLAQVSETKEWSSSAGEYTISLYEVLARVHGVKIVPQLDTIMASIIKTLSCSAGSFALHQACSKVVPAIARYGIDPTTAEHKKRHIIHSLCKPLSDCLLGSQESLSSGAALCLKALVDSDNWRFASDEMVNEVCLRVVGALEDKPTHTTSHIGLVMALAKHNSLIIEAYGRLLVLNGLRILNVGVVEGNSQKRLSAIQMVNYLMRCLDSKCIFSELAVIIKEMDKCQSDQMAYVRGAAFEALQTAKKIAKEKGLKFDKDVTSIAESIGLRSGQRDTTQRRKLWDNGHQSSLSASPESQTLDNFTEFGSLADSPIFMRQVSSHLEYDSGSDTRKLWSHENTHVDVSLENGFLSELIQGSSISNVLFEHSGQEEVTSNGGDYAKGFDGLLQRSSRRVLPGNLSPNAQIYSTPRKLIHSLQGARDFSSESSEKQTRCFQNASSSNHAWRRAVENSHNSSSSDVHYELKDHENSSGDFESIEGGLESVSSTDDVPNVADVKASQEHDTAYEDTGSGKAYHKRTSYNIILVLVIVVVVAAFGHFLLIDDREKGFQLVPT